MIGFLNGTCISKQPDSSQCVILSGEVGYELVIHRRLFDKLSPQQPATLWVHTHVKEGVFALYGFQNEMEKKLFRVLLSVSGLGPKTALSLLSEHGAEILVQHILGKKVSEISQAPGVGRKSAERIVLELQPKLEKLVWLQDIKDTLVAPQSAEEAVASTLEQDLSTALLNLGYVPAQVKSTIARHFREHESEDMNFETHLRMLLKILSGRGPGVGQSLDN